MNKIIGVFVLICCTVILLAGCLSGKVEESPHKGTTGGQQLSLEQIITDIEKQGISEINIYKSEGHGTIGKTLMKTLTSSEEYSIVLQSIKTAVRIPGILDTATPNYDFVIRLKNENRYMFHYWLQSTNDMKGMFVDINDTGTGYTISSKSTQDLLKLVE